MLVPVFAPVSSTAQTLVQSLERVYWSKSNQGIPDTNTIVRAIVVSGGNVYAAVFGAGVFQSTDAGATWRAVNKGLTNADIWSLAVGKNGRLYAGTTQGLFYAEASARKGALLWRKTTLLAPVHALTITERGVVAGSLDSVLFSDHSLKAWRATYRGNRNWLIKSLATNGTTLFAGSSGGILRSADGGATWAEANEGFRYPMDVWSLAAHRGVVFAATADGVYRSVNNGETWDATSNTEHTRSLNVAGEILYAGSIGAVLRSADNGASWSVAHEGLPNLNIWAVAQTGKMLLAGASAGVYSVEEQFAFAGRKLTLEGDRVVAEPLLRATALPRSGGGNAAEEPLRSILIEEFAGERIHSLLNYVFFDENAAFVPLRYKNLRPKEAELFAPERLTGRETLEAYRDILNIVGARMKRQSQATLTIAGHNAGAGFEANNEELSMRRALAVQQYLSSVWKISPERLEIAPKGLPDKPSRQGDALSDQENRRVELFSSWDILKPVAVWDTAREASPAAVRLRPQIIDTTELIRWRLTVEYNGRALKHWEGAGAHSLPRFVDWIPDAKYLSAQTAQEIEKSAAVECRLEATYKYRAQPVLSRAMAIPLERVSLSEKRARQKGDVAKHRYNLILFDIGSDKLSHVNERIVREIKNSAVFSAGASVRIMGYTDAIGAEDVNLLLSQRRAQTVAEALGVAKESVREFIVKGRGEILPLLYENDTPEGRFYCRAVVVEVDSPVTFSDNDE